MARSVSRWNVRCGRYSEPVSDFFCVLLSAYIGDASLRAARETRVNRRRYIRVRSVVSSVLTSRVTNNTMRPQSSSAPFHKRKHVRWWSKRYGDVYTRIRVQVKRWVRGVVCWRRGFEHYRHLPRVSLSIAIKLDEESLDLTLSWNK